MFLPFSSDGCTGSLPAHGKSCLATLMVVCSLTTATLVVVAALAGML